MPNANSSGARRAGRIWTPEYETRVNGDAMHFVTGR